MRLQSPELSPRRVAILKHGAESEAISPLGRPASLNSLFQIYDLAFATEMFADDSKHNALFASYRHSYADAKEFIETNH
jgi:hypothetical protein